MGPPRRRLPLGTPSQLTLEALKLAAQLVGTPASSTTAGLAAEREAGFVVLGAATLALPAEAVASQRSELLGLWSHALGEHASAEMDVAAYLAVRLLANVDAAGVFIALHANKALMTTSQYSLCDVWRRTFNLTFARTRGEHLWG